MRASSLALRWSSLPLASLLLLGCPSEEVGGVEIGIARGQLDANPAVPDGLATLDLTVELQAQDLATEVTLSRVTITEQPVTDASPELDLGVEMINTVDDGSVVRLAAGEMGVARVNNTGTTNAQLETWCRKPVLLTVVVDTPDGESEASSDITVRCP